MFYACMEHDTCNQMIFACNMLVKHGWSIDPMDMVDHDYVPCYSSVIDAPPTPISPFKPHDAFFPKVDMNFPVSMKDGVAVVDLPAKHKEEAVGLIHMCELFFCTTKIDA